MTNEIIAKRIKRLRAVKNLTLQDLADVTGVNKSTVWGWENGRVGALKTSVIELIADKYGINPLWLIFDDETKMDPPTENERKIINQLLDLIGNMDENQLAAMLVMARTLLGEK